MVANRPSSWYAHPVITHSGEYSFVVAACVSGATTVGLTSRITDVTPASLSRAIIWGACACASVVACVVSSGASNAFTTGFGTPFFRLLVEVVEVELVAAARRRLVDDTEGAGLLLEPGVAGVLRLLAGHLGAEPLGDVGRVQVGVLAGPAVRLLGEVVLLRARAAERHHDLLRCHLGDEHVPTGRRDDREGFQLGDAHRAGALRRLVGAGVRDERH